MVAMSLAGVGIGVSMDANAGGLDGGSVALSRQEAIGTGAQVTATTDGGNGVAIGYNATSSGAYAIAIGGTSLAAGMQSTAVGVFANVAEGTVNGVALGFNASVTGNGAMALGAQSQASGFSGVAVGSFASASVANAVSYDSAAHNQVTLGGSASAPKVKLTNLQDGELSATSSDAVTGAQLWNTNQQVANLNQAVQNQQSTGSSALAIDTSGAPAATATGSGAIAMGGGAQANGDNSVALGAGSVADQANTVSVGSPGNERRITNVADGQGPTDAVNMRQFQQGMGSVARNAYSGVAAATALTMIPEVDPGKTLAVGIAGGNYKGYQAVALGASARITANLKLSNLQDGELSATSTDAVTGAQLSSTNQNLADLTQSVKSAMSVNTAGLPAPTSSGTNAVAFGGGAQASGDNSVAIGAGSVADQANTFSVGSQGNERRIVNVANGTQGTDAVNVNQLNEAKTQAKNYTDKIAKNAYAGVAAAMAMPNMTPSGPGKTVVAAGGGTYKGASAGAVGVTYRSQTGHWLANGAVSVTSTGDAGARAQVGYEF